MINNFHSKIHYDRYLLWKKYAEKINDYLENGYMVFDKYGNRIYNKFEFDVSGCINLPISDNSAISYVGDIMSGDENPKIFIEENKKQIKEFFSKWKIVNPKHIRRLK